MTYMICNTCDLPLHWQGTSAPYKLGADAVASLHVRNSVVMQVALKATDIGHLAAPLAVHKRWTSQLTEEFFCQGDRKPFAQIEHCMLRYQCQ